MTYCSYLFTFLLMFLLCSSHSYSQEQAPEEIPVEDALPPQQTPPPPPTPSSEQQLLMEPQEAIGVSKVISLKTILEQGLRENFQERSRQVELLILDIKRKGERERYWFPRIGFAIQTTEQSVGKLYSQDNQNQTSTLPTGKVGLEIQDYTIFNWGIDYLTHEKTISTLLRKKEEIDELRRELKHQLVYLYFQLVKDKNCEFQALEQVRHSTFLYRLAKEKASMQKLSRQTYLQIRTLYLIKQQEYNQARIRTLESQKRLAHQLGDPPETIYKTTEELKFMPLHLPLSESLGIYQGSNPLIKDKKVAFENANREYQKSKLENLPLPRFSLNFGTYMFAFAPNGQNTTWDTSPYPGGRNLELRASIMMSWDLLGEKGFFNTRNKTSSFYEMNKAQIELHGAQNLISNQIRKLYQEVQEEERQVEIVKALKESGQKQFDETYNNYVDERSSFIEVKDALDTMYQTYLLYEGVKLQHLKSKLNLAELIGIEDFPGDYFENLGTKEG